MKDVMNVKVREIMEENSDCEKVYIRKPIGDLFEGSYEDALKTEYMDLYATCYGISTLDGRKLCIRVEQ